MRPPRAIILTMSRVLRRMLNMRRKHRSHDGSTGTPAATGVASGTSVRCQEDAVGPGYPRGCQSSPTPMSTPIWPAATPGPSRMRHACAAEPSVSRSLRLPRSTRAPTRPAGAHLGSAGWRRLCETSSFHSTSSSPAPVENSWQRRGGPGDGCTSSTRGLRQPPSVTTSRWERTTNGISTASRPSVRAVTPGWPDLGSSRMRWCC